MNKRRVQRISAEIQKVVSHTLYNGINDPRIDPIKTAITAVDVTNDLSFAYIYVSVIGNEEEKEATLEGFERAQGFLKKEIGEQVEIRHVPQLIFKLDESTERGQKIENLLKELKSDD